MGALRTIALSYYPVSIPGDCTKLSLSSPVIGYFAEGFEHESQENCKDITSERRLISVTRPFDAGGTSKSNESHQVRNWTGVLTTSIV
jgi:hypothetical protein